MFDTIAGLPIHPLVVHAVEVIVPLAALTLLLSAVWPRFRRWAYALPLLLSLGGLLLVPIATQSGEALEERVSENATLERHTQMGENLLPWVIGLVVLAAALTWMEWQARRAAASGAGTSSTRAALTRPAPRWLAIVLIVGALVVSTGTIVEAIQIGHSGATAVWGQTGASTSGEGAGESDGD